MLCEVDSGDDIEGDKRQYMPWLLRWRCEKCGDANEVDFSSDYLSYPVFGKEYEVTLCCHRCGSKDGEPSHVVKVIPRLTLELVDHTSD